jgi:hypothetical protein
MRLFFCLCWGAWMALALLAAYQFFFGDKAQLASLGLMLSGYVVWKLGWAFTKNTPEETREDPWCRLAKLMKETW